MSSSSPSSNAAAAALDLLRQHPVKPERHGAVLVWRRDVSAELLLLTPPPSHAGQQQQPPSSLPPPPPPPPALRRLLDDCFRRRFAAPPHALPDVVASAYAPAALFRTNLATVAGVGSIAAAWRFLAAPFVAVGVVGGAPSRVEVVAWAPAEAAIEAAAVEEQGWGGGGAEAAGAAGAAAARGAAEPPAGPLPFAPPLPPPTRPAPTRPPAAAAPSVALLVETEQLWRLARALVLVRAVFGNDVRVAVTSALRLSRRTGKVLSHEDRVEGWWTVPGPLRAALGALAPVVAAVLGWW